MMGDLIDMTKITVRHVNSAGIAYGEPIPPEDIRAEAAEAVTCKILETDEDTGEVTVGGQRYRWSRDGGVRQSIRISDGTEVVGYGTIAGGRIECDAELGWATYDAIEAAIAADRDAAEAGGVIYRWEIGG